MPEGRFRITHEYIDAMRDTMIHRGPDGAGTWVSNDGRVGLGHRRLSIIDLSDSASQPMSSPDGQFRLYLTVKFIITPHYAKN